MLKVAVIGCGKIADSHVLQIRRIEGCEIVAACDVEPLMAQQLCERFGIPGCFSELSELLSAVRPDVVHITTPPQTHFAIARQCLEAGCHTYVEKPFTVNAQEAEELIDLATSTGRKLTVGHDDQFRHAARRARALVKQGFLGSGPVHMESYYCYELGRSAYASALLGDPGHWVRRLPGQLLQNIISHGIARVSEYLTVDSPEIIAYGFTSPLLRSMGETEIIDELRVIICEQERITAYFTFSSQMKPSLHEFRIYGDKNGLILDQDQETVIKLRGTRHKSYAEKFIPPLSLARQYLGNLSTNLRSFVLRDFHMKSGMKYLMESFYRSITDDAPLPISYREILLTANIMDEIFRQLNSKERGGKLEPAVESSACN